MMYEMLVLKVPVAVQLVVLSVPIISASLLWFKSWVNICDSGTCVPLAW